MSSRDHYDTAGHGWQAALRCACDAFGPQHLVTGSDHPPLMDYEPYSETFAYIRRSDLPPEYVEQIMRRSAAELLGGLLAGVR
jgi:6-methylsalicylate decarboxylase